MQQNIYEISKKEKDSLLAIGEQYLSMQKFDEAQVIFKGAYALNPKDKHFFLALVEVYLLNGEEEKALELLDSSENKWSSSLEIIRFRKRANLLKEISNRP